MARSKQIRLTKNDRKEYSRLVKNAKAKISRLNKKFDEDIRNQINLDMPKVNQIKTREEFNQIKEQLEDFSKAKYEKNQYGVVASRKEIYEATRKNKEEQRRAKKELEKVKNKPLIVDGKEVGKVGQQIEMVKDPEELVGIHIPTDFDFNKYRTRTDFERKVNSMEKRLDPHHYDKKKSQMKTNFMEILSLSFNWGVDDLVEKIRQMPDEDFYEIYIMHPDISFNLYSSEGNPLAEVGEFNELIRAIDSYYNGKIDMDLRDF